MMDVEIQTMAGTRAEELAYMLLEEARLRCRALLDDGRHVHDDPVAVRDPDTLGLIGLYGDLGIAGYYASARLEPAHRRQLLARARARAKVETETESASSSAQALANATAAATRTVERALAITGLLDHMHLAHIHVMSACETLDMMFALQA